MSRSRAWAGWGAGLGALLALGAAGAAQPVPDRIWPVRPEQPVVCFWRDDKLAAFSLTIDDNHVQDHAFWLEAGAARGWRWTWFIIAGRVGKPGPWGTWDNWRALRAAGHDVQSHSMYHLDPRQAEPLNIEQEYAEAQRLIEQQIPGARCLTLAYPNGYVPPNDADLAARYYLACRGVKGMPNPPCGLSYREVNSVSAAAGFAEPETHWASFAGYLNPARPGKYRGWYCCHFHGLTDDLKTRVKEMLAILERHQAEVWVAPFREVAQYGQQRDAAVLTVREGPENGLLVELTDGLSDASFDQPLTIKVRLPDEWDSALAGQGEQALPLQLIPHEGALYALVPVVPDRGPVELLWVKAKE